MSWRNAEPLSPRTTASTLLWVCIGLTAFTLFQCIPLPLGLLGALAPQNADVWMRALGPLHQDGPSFAPISLDPNATHIEALRGITYAIVFLCAIRLTATRRGVLVLSTSIVVTGLALGLASLLHPAFGLHKVFGIYQPETQIGDRHIAPLLNPNTLAAYINIAFALALAQAISPRPQIPRYASGGAAIFLIVVQVWIASRGGMLSMGIAALAVFALDRAARSHTNRSMRADVVALACLAGVAVVMIVLASADEAWNELASRDLSKFSLFKNVLLTVRRFPLFGLGRGAFQSVFPADRVGSGFYVFTHPENVILQWTTEWGVPVGLAALGAVAWSLRPRVALARGHVAVGAWAALFGVAVHNLVDFSSEVPGVVIALVACGAIVTGGSRGEASTSRAHTWAGMGTRVAFIAGITAACAIAVVALGFDADLYADRTRLHEMASDTGTSREEFDREARAAMLRHPAEPYLPFMGAVRASRTHDESVIGWAEKVLERAPVYGPVHI
ncbi:MAG: O-antigen ligase family protein, partial [Polyangiaceae bacterium]